MKQLVITILTDTFDGMDTALPVYFLLLSVCGLLKDVGDHVFIPLHVYI